MQVVLQLYRDNGEFIDEFELMYAEASLSNELFSYFKKDKNLLYILDTETSEKFDQFHKIYEYRIEE
jgi:chloramphenicol O-acetyltransferase